MRQPVDDTRIDTITLEALPPRSPKRVRVSADGDLLPIKHVLESASWGHLDMWARQSADDAGFGTDAGDVVFAGTPEVEELKLEAFEGVLFVDGADNQVVVSKPAFRRLMDRMFSGLIEFADAQQLDVRQDERWSAFLEHAARLKELVAG